MGWLSAIVFVLLGTVCNRKQHLAVCSRIAPQFVCDYSPWWYALTFKQFTEKPLGSFLIPTFLHQNIDRVAILVNSPPEVTQFATDLDEHLVAIPGVT